MSEQITETSTGTDLNEIVASAFEAETYTPYAAAKVVNGLLEKFELKTIPPQMVYQYCTKGYISGVTKSTRTTKNDKVVTDVKVTAAGMVEWTMKYLAKNTAK